jgi:hypothetical protein
MSIHPVYDKLISREKKEQLLNQKGPSILAFMVQVAVGKQQLQSNLKRNFM